MFGIVATLVQIVESLIFVACYVVMIGDQQVIPERYRIYQNLESNIDRWQREDYTETYYII